MFFWILLVIGFLLAVAGVHSSLEKGNDSLGIPAMIFGILFMIVSFIFILYLGQKTDSMRVEYEKNIVLETKNAQIAKLDIVKHTTSSYSELEFIMLLKDGKAETVDSELYAKLNEGMTVYWDICIEKCKYYEYDDSDRNYYIK